MDEIYYRESFESGSLMVFSTVKRVGDTIYVSKAEAQ